MNSSSILEITNKDRTIVCGGSQSGKSTICAGSKDFNYRHSILGLFQNKYENSKILIVDTKPRFRAQYNVAGMSDKSHYKKWKHGAIIPRSTRINVGDDRELEIAVTRSDVVILQSDKIDEEVQDVARTIDKFRNASDTKQDRLVYIDEVMDFYTSNGMPLRGTGNILIRCARAGAERNIATVIASQRLKGIPTQFFELCTKIYLFRLDFTPDYKRLAEAGAPKNFYPPAEDHIFKVWDKNIDRKKIFGPYKIEM